MEEFQQILDRMDKIEQRLAFLESRFTDPHYVNPANAGPNGQHQVSNQNVQPNSHNAYQSQPQPNSQQQRQFPQPVKTPFNANFKAQVEKRASNFELEFGTKWISRIGIIAILLSVVFFLKYSFENNLIGAQGRIFVGIIFGISMLIGGDFLLKKYRITSNVVTGGAISILAFTVFASYNFYEFIGQTTAFILLLVLILMSTFLSLRYNSVTVMHYGVLTGFLTPFLISAGTPNDRFYLTYLCILNVGIMLVTYFKNWKSLYYVSFFVSAISFGIWMGQRFKIYDFSEINTQYFIASVALSALFAQYLFISICMNLGKKIKIESFTFDFYLMFLNAIYFFGVGYYIVDNYNSDLDGIFTLILSIVYFGLFMFIKSSIKDAKPLLLSLLALSMLFITITIPVQLDGNAITLAWSLEALFLAIISGKIELPQIKKAYLIVSSLAVFMLMHDLFNLDYNEKTLAFLNVQSLIFVASIISLAVMAYIVKSGLPRITVVYLIVLNLLFLGFLLIETNNAYSHLIHTNESLLNYYSNSEYIYAIKLTQSVILFIYSMILITIGIINKSKSTRVFALVLFAFSICKVFFYDLNSLEGIYRIISFVGLGIILIAISLVYQKFKHIIVGGTENDEKMAN